VRTIPRNHQDLANRSRQSGSGLNPNLSMLPRFAIRDQMVGAQHRTGSRFTRQSAVCSVVGRFAGAHVVAPLDSRLQLGR